MTVPKGTGQAWWGTLSPKEKEAVVAQYLDKSKSCTEIADILGLPGRNQVMTVRIRIKAHRVKHNIPMDNWTQNSDRFALNNIRARGARRTTKANTRVINNRRGERLPDIEVDPEKPETIEGSALQRGKPPFMSSRQRRERGFLDREPTGAFEGIPRDIAEAFAYREQ